MPTITLRRVQKEYGFEAKDEYGHIVKMDSSDDSGGNNFGVRPMQMLLMGLAGCSAIDVIMILNKQRQIITDYKMVIKGDRDSGKEPSLWKNITIEFHLYGTVDLEKAIKAVELSITKYCSVSATLEASGSTIKTETFVHI